MKRPIVAWLAAALLLAAGAETAHAGQFIMRAKSADVPTLCLRYNLTDLKDVYQKAGDEICVVQSATQTAADDAALRSQVLADPLVEGFEPDTQLALAETASPAGLSQSTAAILEQFAQPSATYFGNQVAGAYVSQPATSIIRLSRAQQLATGAGVVAVIDTGVDGGHAALAGALVPGYDFVNGVPGLPSDFADISQSTAAILEQAIPGQNGVAQLSQSTAAILEQSTAAILETAGLPPAFGHGTMVAGLIHLVAPTASIMPLKAFNADGTANLSDLVSAIYYAVDNGATVINMSFVLASPSKAMLDAVTYAASNKVLCVAAAGNGGTQVDAYPAAWPGVVDVASTDSLDHRCVFSNWSSRVDLSAPGDSLITPYPGNHYAAVSGTSFSTALVSGSVALIQQYIPHVSESTALKVLEEGGDVSSGLGKARIDLYHALYDLITEVLPR
jgi:hypothetical protein